MTNTRLKKSQTTGNPPEEGHDAPPKGKDESFLDTSEDELTRKRKMILTGITAGVAVAGVSAASLLFLAPIPLLG